MSTITVEASVAAHATRTLQSPLGAVRVRATARGVIDVTLLGEAGIEDSAAGACADAKAEEIAERGAAQLAEYFAGSRREFDVPLDMGGTPFERAAWDALLKIPFGQTRSYGEQAALLGNPKAVRAVGRANGANPIAIIVPCHRVIGADGSLTGYGGGIEKKKWLLEFERRGAPSADKLFA